MLFCKWGINTGSLQDIYIYIYICIGYYGESIQWMDLWRFYVKGGYIIQW